MNSTLYWIPLESAGRLAIMPRPPGGERLQPELQALLNRGVDVVVSLLGADEVLELELQRKPELCAAAGIAFRSFAIPDHGVPPDCVPTRELICWIVATLAEGKGVAIHCWGGIGRSGLIAAAVVVLLGSSSQAACLAVSAARGHTVPETEAQRTWLDTFARQRPTRSPM